MLHFSDQFIKQLQNQDSDSFHIFYEQTIDIFFRYVISNYYFSEAQVHDIIGDFYIKARKALPKYRSKYSFANYIWVILKNTVKDHIKKNTDTPFTTFDTEESNFEDQLLQDSEILELLESDFQREQIQEAMQQLPEADQEIIFLKYIQDLSYDQIANIVNYPEATCRKRASRAMQNLKTLLGS